MTTFGEKYYFKLGDKSAIILGLKKALDSLPYLEAKNTRTYIFDAELQTSLAEFQTYWKLKQTDGSLNAETYAKLGRKINEVVVDQLTLRDPILKKLFYGIGVIPERFKIENGVTLLINNNETPTYPVPGKTTILSSNGNADDDAADKKLAILFGDEKQKPVVNGVTQTGDMFTGPHYVLKNGLVFTIHIFGPTGN